MGWVPTPIVGKSFFVISLSIVSLDYIMRNRNFVSANLTKIKTWLYTNFRVEYLRGKRTRIEFR